MENPTNPDNSAHWPQLAVLGYVFNNLMVKLAPRDERKLDHFKFYRNISYFLEMS